MRLRLAHELLDEDEGTPAEVVRSLRDLWWINRHFGGLSSWRRLWSHFLTQDRASPALLVLDVGAGTGELAAANAAWLHSQGRSARMIVLDRRRSHLGEQRPALVADALRLPLPDRSVDVVTCNLFLHHFHDRPGDEAASRLLHEMMRVARRAVLVNDLERHWLAYGFIRLTAPFFSRITRHDAPRSVGQAYTAGELEALARSLPAERYQLRRLGSYRLGLVLWVAPHA